MKARILCTLGPASLRGDILRRLAERVDYVWIDAAATPPETLESTLQLAHRHARQVPICLQVGSSWSRRPAPVDRSSGLRESDALAIDIGLRHGIRHIARSSARSVSDLDQLRSYLPDHAFLLGLIDSDAALRERQRVVEVVDGIVVDRAYLARTVPIEYVVHYQRAILAESRRARRPVYMVNGGGEPLIAAVPTVAQSSDIANCLLDGAAGVLLGQETATGPDPVESVDRLRRSIVAFEQQTTGWMEAAGDLAGSSLSLPGAMASL